MDSLGLTGRKEGMMGPMYGYQWRFFNAKYDETSGKPLEKGIDQLKNVISTIKNNKDSRRIIMTDYNPCQVSQCVLYPCHSIVIQFYVSDGQLDMFCYNRSQDLFLGVPFNIASSALLLSIIAKICLLQPRYMYISMGDIHVYEQHMDAVLTQCNRKPFKFPILTIKNVQDIEKIVYEDFILDEYQYHPSMKSEMIP